MTTLLSGRLLELLGADECFFRHLEHAELLHYFDVDLHRAAFDEDFFADALGRLEHAHDALELGGEGADDEPRSACRVMISSRFFCTMRSGMEKPGFSAVGRVGGEEEHFFIFEERKLFFFCLGRDAVDMVELAGRR